jgi:hypothetical protein
MRALKISMAIMCIVLGMGIINSIGITNTYPTPATDELNMTEMDGVIQLDDSAEDELSNSLLGWGSVFRLFELMKSMLYYTLLPGDYLYSVGCPLVAAAAVQLAINMITLIGLYQVVSKANFKGME